MTLDPNLQIGVTLTLAQSPAKWATGDRSQRKTTGCSWFSWACDVFCGFLSCCIRQQALRFLSRIAFPHARPLKPTQIAPL